MQYSSDELINKVIFWGSCPKTTNEGWKKIKPIADGYESCEFHYVNPDNTCQLHTKLHIVVAYKNVRFLEYSPDYINDIVIGIDFGLNNGNYIILKISFSTYGKILLTTLSSYKALNYNKQYSSEIISFDEKSSNKYLYIKLMDQIEKIIGFGVNEIEGLIENQVMNNIDWVIKNFGLSERKIQELSIPDTPENYDSPKHM